VAVCSSATVVATSAFESLKAVKTFIANAIVAKEFHQTFRVWAFGRITELARYLRNYFAIFWVRVKDSHDF
jgi:hypothetical protein